MTQLVFIENGRAVTDSLTVAEQFGKEHRNVLADIENQIGKLIEGGMQEWGLLNFQHTHYQHPQNKQWYPKIDMTEEAFAIVAMAYVTPETMKMKVLFLEEFKRLRQQIQSGVDLNGLSPQLQILIQQEQHIKQIQNQVDTLTHGLTAVPDHTKVVQRVNELARWSRIGHNEVYNKIYDVLKARFGIDVKARVENERDRIDHEYYTRTGKHYSISTLKGKVNGIDVMVRMGVLDKFNEILVGMLAASKKTG